MDRAWRNAPEVGARMSKILAAYRRGEHPEGGQESPSELRPIPPLDGKAGPAGGRRCAPEGRSAFCCSRWGPTALP